MNLNINFWGVLLAILFTYSICSILWWMFHPKKSQYHPANTEEELALGVQKAHQVLVGVTDTAISERLVRVACGIAQEYEAIVNILYVIEIPKTLPLDADMPEQVNRSKVIFARAEEIGSAHKVKIRPIVIRARFAGNTIIEASKRYCTEFIVLGAKKSFSSRLFGSSADFVLRNAECDVIVDRFQLTDKLQAC